MQRLRNLGSISNSISAANLKRKSRNSIAAIQETFHSTKDTFERHRIVFTVGTSIASVATAFIGLFQFPHHQHNLISLLFIFLFIF
jgi:lysosomal acid lipase/cholesteryl ester hydrolase